MSTTVSSTVSGRDACMLCIEWTSNTLRKYHHRHHCLDPCTKPAPAIPKNLEVADPCDDDIPHCSVSSMAIYEAAGHFDQR
jgi:hypothetical protein